MDISGNLIDNLLGVIFGKWRARRKRSTKFMALKREILYTGIVNDYPIALHRLRVFIIENDIVEKPGFKEFFERWLSDPVVESGKPVLASSRFSKDNITKLREDLQRLRL